MYACMDGYQQMGMDEYHPCLPGIFIDAFNFEQVKELAKLKLFSLHSFICFVHQEQGAN